MDGGNSTKAGMIDYLFENRPGYLLIDEIDKSAPKHQIFLLNLMETGITSETKFGKTRETKMEVSVFATSNDPRKLSSPLQSRFFVAQVEPYSYEQFYQITLGLLKNQTEFAPAIADMVWKTSRNIRDCVRIGKLVRSDEDVNFLVDKFISHGEGGEIKMNHLVLMAVVVPHKSILLFSFTGEYVWLLNSTVPAVAMRNNPQLFSPDPGKPYQK